MSATSVVNGLKTLLVPRLRMEAEKKGGWQGEMKGRRKGGRGSGGMAHD